MHQFGAAAIDVEIYRFSRSWPCSLVRQAHFVLESLCVNGGTEELRLWDAAVLTDPNQHCNAFWVKHCCGGGIDGTHDRPLYLKS